MTPRFKEVPQHWKHPEGPYRRAPAEYGGEWWLTNPFASPTPWLTQSKPAREEKLPSGFADLFGPRPKASSFRETPNPSLYFRLALVKWEQDLQHFKRAGVPEWAGEEALRDAAHVFESWDMGEPRYYEGRYGWSARFPDSELPEFDAAARAAIETTHLVVAQYQMALLEQQLTPKRKHPFVPPQVWPDESETTEEE